MAAENAADKMGIPLVVFGVISMVLEKAQEHWPAIYVHLASIAGPKFVVTDQRRGVATLAAVTIACELLHARLHLPASTAAQIWSAALDQLADDPFVEPIVRQILDASVKVPGDSYLRTAASVFLMKAFPADVLATVGGSVVTRHEDGLTVIRPKSELIEEMVNRLGGAQGRFKKLHDKGAV
jgi:hypothetical protein